MIIAIPITIGASIMPIMNTIDLAIVQRRLVDAGFTAHEANRLYGQLTGLAGPLINFPQVLTQAIDACSKDFQQYGSNIRKYSYDRNAESE